MSALWQESKRIAADLESQVQMVNRIGGRSGFDLLPHCVVDRCSATRREVTTHQNAKMGRQIVIMIALADMQDIWQV
jgi:hypothetical protein